jgi:hypothetical protein
MVKLIIKIDVKIKVRNKRLVIMIILYSVYMNKWQKEILIDN